MPRNGTGIYSLPTSGNPVVAGTIIDPAWANSTLTDIASAMSASIAADGETPITGNLPMAGFKHTGAGAPTAPGQYLVFGSPATIGALTVAGAITAAGTVTGTKVSVAQTGAFDDNFTFDALGVVGGAVGYNNSASTNAYGAITGVVYFGVAQAVPMVFTSGAAEWLRTDGTGKVFIGTASGAAKVNVVNTGTGQTLNLLNSSAGSGSTVIGALTNGTDADFSVTISQVGAASKFTRIGTSVANPLSFQTAGTNWLTLDGVGRLSGTALHNNSTLPAGTVNQYVASGTYTPTLTNVQNFSAITALSCQWMRVGNTVTVSGSFNATATASVQVVMGISLPIPSTLGSAGSLSGLMPSQNGSINPGGITGYIKGDTSNNRAQGAVLNDSFNGAGTWGFHFTYVIL